MQCLLKLAKYSKSISHQLQPSFFSNDFLCHISFNNSSSHAEYHTYASIKNTTCTAMKYLRREKQIDALFLTCKRKLLNPQKKIPCNSCMREKHMFLAPISGKACKNRVIFRAFPKHFLLQICTACSMQA